MRAKMSFSRAVSSPLQSSTEVSPSASKVSRRSILLILDSVSQDLHCAVLDASGDWQLISSCRVSDTSR